MKLITAENIRLPLQKICVQREQICVMTKMFFDGMMRQWLTLAALIALPAAPRESNSHHTGLNRPVQKNETLTE